MLTCFEHWFGPYPWYEDGYKLIEAPHLGMEHQSGVAYGNQYKNGYLGRDLSGTGRGMKWDFIIVHESAHEWWGNSITAQRTRPTMWIHESFANYSEGIYTECQDGKQAGAEYIIGNRRNIKNDTPDHRPVRREQRRARATSTTRAAACSTCSASSSTTTRSGAAFCAASTATFWHQTVTADQIESYISRSAGMDFSKIFQQYLTTTEFRFSNTRSTAISSRHIAGPMSCPGSRCRCGRRSARARPTGSAQPRRGRPVSKAVAADRFGRRSIRTSTC